MNDLTGAFLNATKKGENPLITRQSLANAGYSIQEIEEAFSESKQMALPKKTFEREEEEQKKGSFKGILLIVAGVFFTLAVLGIFAYFYFGGK